jgi:cobalamin biosynthesis protein CobW
VLRVKGFIEIAGKPMRLAIQGVGDRIQHYFDRPWQADEKQTGKLVVIGEHDLDEGAIRSALAQPASLAA